MSAVVSKDINAWGYAAFRSEAIKRPGGDVSGDGGAAHALHDNMADIVELFRKGKGACTVPALHDSVRECHDVPAHSGGIGGAVGR